MEKNKELQVSEMMIQRLEAEYPVLDVRQQIRNMQNWWKANPRKRKQPAGEYRFCINWLNKAHTQIAVAQANARSYARVGDNSREAGLWVDGVKIV